MNFTGRTVIVTGGTGALGRVLAKRFSELGARLAIPSHSSRSADSAAEWRGNKNVMFAKADLRQEAEAAGFARQAYEEFGSIDVLVNAAGGYAGGRKTEELSATDMMDMVQLNLLSALNACSKVLPFMKQAGYGRIVNVAAMAAIHPQSGAGPYAISKAALITLTETLAIENKRTGITANAVAPGTIDTEANRIAMPGADYSKWTTPGQISDVILFLASESASAVSGNVIMMP